MCDIARPERDKILQILLAVEQTCQMKAEGWKMKTPDMFTV